jgi:anaerobic magnesium-protoporphyrin IX monomethyl ester cyclase
MYVALVNLAASNTHQMPPLGIMYLSAVLKQNVDVMISVYDELIDLSDFTTVETVCTKIMNGAPDILCFSVYTEHHQYLQRLIKSCRHHSSGYVEIILGGPHASLATASCVETLDATCVVRGPGENVLPAIIRKIKAQMKNNTSKNVLCEVYTAPISCAEDLALPDILPDRECLNMSAYQHPFTMMTSRGCPGKCIFCASPVLNRGLFFPRSIESIRCEIEYLVLKHCASKIAFLDDSFTYDYTRLEQVCDCLAGYGLKWFCESRIDCVDDTRLRMMATSGCSELQFGIECFDQNLSDAIEKRIDTSRIHKVLQSACDLGIKVAVSFILGLPGDTVTSIRARIKQAVELADIGVQVIEFSCLRPFPGTAIYSNAKDMGYHDVTNWWERDCILPLCFPSASITREELCGMLIYAGYKVQMTSRAVCETTVRASSV